MSAHTVEEVLPEGHKALPAVMRQDLSQYDHNIPATLVLPRLVFAAPAHLEQSQVVASLKAGLANVLSNMPFLGGKLYEAPSTKKLYVLRRNHEPVKFGINHLDTPEASFPDYETLAAQHFPGDVFSTNISKAVNFIKGGIILTLGMNHLYGDAKSIDHVFSLCATSTKAALSHHPPPSFHPILNRNYFTATSIPSADELEVLKRNIKGFTFMKIDPSNTANSDPAPISATSTETYHFSSAAACRRLKAALTPSPPGLYVSTYDCIAAATWRAMTKARAPYLGLGDASTTRYSHPRRRAPLPQRPGRLLRQRLLDSADGAREGGRDVRRGRAREDRAGRAQVNPRSLRRHDPGLSARANVIGTSWDRMRVERYDFGIMRPRNLSLAVSVFEGMVAIVPALGEDGDRDGFQACVVLEKGCLERMKGDEEFRALYTD
ncbi:hypothetical protein N7470_008392 [Penicillium chermesinum]|nr:hypothetical protein N7470_008392 [Penicillium chermesinum]